MTPLEQEVRTLQKQVRRQRRWNIALGVMVVVGGLMAAKGIQEVPDVIRAKKFEVVNDEGKVFVVMNSLFHQGEHYGFVTTQNGKGQTLVELGASTDGKGFVQTQNGKGQTLVALSVNSDGNGLIQTQNGKGQVLVVLAATTDGQGTVETQNGKGQKLVQLGTTPMGGRVMCTNAIGKDVALIAVSPLDGSGVVVTMDPSGKDFTSTTPTQDFLSTTPTPEP